MNIPLEIGRGDLRKALGFFQGSIRLSVIREIGKPNGFPNYTTIPLG
jgi:hypothetical protein